MSIESDFIWFDGEMVPFDQAHVHVLSHTLHYGLGVFEGIRAYEQPDGTPGIWRLREHLKRFVDSLKMMYTASPYTIEELEQACIDALKVNKFSAAYIRPLAFLGHGQMGLGARGNRTHVIVATWKWGAYLGEDGLNNGVDLGTSTFTRNHPNATLQRAKVVGHYVNSIMARYEANENGFDEAMMLDQNGYVAEGTGENIFVVENNVITTPPVANILPGITRQTVLEIAQHHGLEVREQFFGRDALYSADEAFMCGTAAEVTPIRTLDRRTVGNGTPGPVTKAIQGDYLAGVRGNVPWLAKHITRCD
jgi:branched-chain amino acid aminotransferase